MVQGEGSIYCSVYPSDASGTRVIPPPVSKADSEGFSAMEGSKSDLEPSTMTCNMTGTVGPAVGIWMLVWLLEKEYAHDCEVLKGIVIGVVNLSNSGEVEEATIVIFDCATWND